KDGERVLVKNPKVHQRLGWVTLICFICSIVTAYSVYTMLFVIYNPARNPSYGIKSSIGALSGIGSFLILSLVILFWYVGREKRKRMGTPS
ncbi:MAG: DUF420 domain-containing protein, partial [Nitrospiraceae bacterium]|nr:DUF420 domain-containing protein [Nitrospiraceae bacterium]